MDVEVELNQDWLLITTSSEGPRHLVFRDKSESEMMCWLGNSNPTKDYPVTLYKITEHATARLQVQVDVSRV